jgi:hypothetical protein
MAVPDMPQPQEPKGKKMTKRYCQTGRIECPHLPACGEDCHFDTASLNSRTIFSKSTEQPEPDDGWSTAGRLMIGAVLAVAVAFFVVMFMTGFFLWSLLI